ncbi:SgcJ/EcaC family oxidoreductase [Actinoplanes sp. NPDC051470]|uniref:SgcJ/EcaC family oxidoreductase n=1 Tax=Actinoplanes sp. NPDC051470 TaxID=3157224 RepID=UPI003425FD7F
MDQSIETMSAIPARMCEAWNRGDAAGFYADFAADAELVEFEGTIQKGRDTLVAFQQPAFDTMLKGSSLVDSDVPFARIVAPGAGVVHHRFGVLMPGAPAPARLMQLLAVVWQNSRWEVATLQNARVVPLAALPALESIT